MSDAVRLDNFHLASVLLQELAHVEHRTVAIRTRCKRPPEQLTTRRRAQIGEQRTKDHHPRVVLRQASWITLRIFGDKLQAVVRYGCGSVTPRRGARQSAHD